MQVVTSRGLPQRTIPKVLKDSLENLSCVRCNKICKKLRIFTSGIPSEVGAKLQISRLWRVSTRDRDKLRLKTQMTTSTLFCKAKTPLLAIRATDRSTAAKSIQTVEAKVKNKIRSQKILSASPVERAADHDQTLKEKINRSPKLRRSSKMPRLGATNR